MQKSNAVSNSRNKLLLLRYINNLVHHSESPLLQMAEQLNRYMAPTAQPVDTPTSDRKRKERHDRDNKSDTYDMYVCLTSRPESETTGYLTPYLVVFPELTSISETNLSMAQAVLGCFLVPRSGDQKDNLPSISNDDALIDPVVVRLQNSPLYRALHLGLEAITLGVLWQDNGFQFDPGAVTYANMVNVDAHGKFNCMYFLYITV